MRNGCCKQVLSLHPTRVNDALLLGNIYLRSKDFANAIEHVMRAERTPARADDQPRCSLWGYQQNEQVTLPTIIGRWRSTAIQPIRKYVVPWQATTARDSGNYSQLSPRKGIRNQPHVKPVLLTPISSMEKASEAAMLYHQAADVAEATPLSSSRQHRQRSRAVRLEQADVS